MSRYKAYAEYKDSGGEWLGQAPAQWKLMQAKFSFVLQRGHDLSSDEMIQGDYLVFGSNGPIGTHNIFTTEGPSITVGRSGSVGEINYIDQNFWAHNTSLYVKDFKGSPPRFIYYLLVAINPKRLSAGSAVGTLDRNNIHSQIVALPSFFEQQTIANFLDHETAKIDTLIAKQQGLIKLLKEKRQAVISHAVTKGLNPNAPMRDSGVEWLGEVPAHWEIKRLKHLVVAPLMYGANEAAIDSNINNPRFIRITDIQDDGTLKSDTFCSLNEDLARPYLLDDGDVLLARTGGTVGKSFMYENSWGRCCFAGYLIKASLNKSEIFAKWFYQYAQTQYYWEWIGSNQIQATLQNVSADKYNNFLMAIPPLEEQKRILANLEKSLDTFDELISKAQITIQFIQERRAALISAAVTGKIDVRDWQPTPNPELEEAAA